MGYKTFPPYAQLQVDKVLRNADYNSFAKGFIDDIVIFSKSFEEYEAHLMRVFETPTDWISRYRARSRTAATYPSSCLVNEWTRWA